MCEMMLCCWWMLCESWADMIHSLPFHLQVHFFPEVMDFHCMVYDKVDILLQPSSSHIISIPFGETSPAFVKYSSHSFAQ